MLMVTMCKIRALSDERSTISIGSAHTGYLVSYPVIGSSMMVFENHQGNRLVTTPVCRVLGDLRERRVYVETENSVYRLRIHGNALALIGSASDKAVAS